MRTHPNYQVVVYNRLECEIARSEIENDVDVAAVTVDFINDVCQVLSVGDTIKIEEIA
jgi:hypothetical protein